MSILATTPLHLNKAGTGSARRLNYSLFASEIIQMINVKNEALHILMVLKHQKLCSKEIKQRSGIDVCNQRYWLAILHKHDLVVSEWEEGVDVNDKAALQKLREKLKRQPNKYWIITAKGVEELEKRAEEETHFLAQCMKPL